MAFILQRREQALGAVFTAPGQLEIDRHTLVQPDVFVLPLVEARRPVRDDDIGHPLLLIEVLSPGTARFDRVVKRERYLRHGVEYWIADLDARLVERWVPAADRPEIVTGTLLWQPPAAAHPLALDLNALFAEALGER
jgi:Uma2 family endonuclease